MPRARVIDFAAFSARADTRLTGQARDGGLKPTAEGGLLGCERGDTNGGEGEPRQLTGVAVIWPRPSQTPWLR
jgi:hypothetical protein